MCTDGSWLGPQKWFLGVGGAGVFWPKRCIDKHSLNDLDASFRKPVNKKRADIASCRQTKKGLTLWTKAAAYSGNSIRVK